MWDLVRALPGLLKSAWGWVACGIGLASALGVAALVRVTSWPGWWVLVPLGVILTLSLHRVAYVKYRDLWRSWARLRTQQEADPPLDAGVLDVQLAEWPAVDPSSGVTLGTAFGFQTVNCSGRALANCRVKMLGVAHHVTSGDSSWEVDPSFRPFYMRWARANDSISQEISAGGQAECEVVTQTFGAFHRQGEGLPWTMLQGTHRIDLAVEASGYPHQCDRGGPEALQC